MLDRNTADFFADLELQAPDPLLSLIALCRNDRRPEKLDLGVGVYRDEAGTTPVMRAIKAAERRLAEDQTTKAYLGPEGDTGFVSGVARLALGHASLELMGFQTPGGTGALRLAAALVRAARPDATLWIGSPSWPIHAGIFAAAGVRIRTYEHYDPTNGVFNVAGLTTALARAQAGDVFLLHACCHNPSGADPDPAQWGEIARLMAYRGVLPFIDMAYQGLGDGLDEDARGARNLVSACDSALVAYSCDKNFGLYRERTGALFAKAPASAETVRSNLASLARTLWSMPPDHGAAAARIILETPELEADWRLELDAARDRLGRIRRALADAHPRLERLRAQKGLFSLLPLTPTQIAALREDHAVYMAGSGRINIAGLGETDVARFARAFDAVLSL